MNIFFQKLQIVTAPMAFAAVFFQVVIIPCDGNLRMSGKVQQVDITIFRQTI